jgi:hypothetical protein
MAIETFESIIKILFELDVITLLCEEQARFRSFVHLADMMSHFISVSRHAFPPFLQRK